jgi:hypothetical protein
MPSGGFVSAIFFLSGTGFSLGSYDRQNGNSFILKHLVALFLHFPVSPIPPQNDGGAPEEAPQPHYTTFPGSA